jgi:hypothetical protein
MLTLLHVYKTVQLQQKLEYVEEFAHVSFSETLLQPLFDFQSHI